MIRLFLSTKRAVAGGEKPDFDALEWELSELQQRISEHRNESVAIYDDFESRQADLQADLDLTEAGTDDHERLSAEIRAIRAERVGVANVRTAQRVEMLGREREIERLLAEAGR